MVTEIKEYALDLENHNAAYSRFVPKEFLNQLGQTTILQVKLGDQIQKQMTVLFADIRSFTAVSETMSPRDNFNFINEYLGRVSPIIRAHGGFVDKFIGDAVMALFPAGAENAVNAALEMQRSLIAFNEEGKEIGRPPIKIGVGLHVGNLMLGTVGECMRMEGTVISSAVNLASRLEGLTKEYGVDIIISDKVFEAIADKKIKCHLRPLGPARVKGKKGEVFIYEVIDSNKDDLSRRKIITLEDFEKAIKAYSTRQYSKALSLLKKVHETSPNDPAVKVLRERCEKYLLLPRRSKNNVSKIYPVIEVSKRGTDDL
jgi:two-component system sensor histidine kinase ChiS